jgi:hypothetical protein
MSSRLHGARTLWTLTRAQDDCAASKAAVILAMTTSRHMTLKGIMMAADDEPPVSRGFVGRRRAPAQSERVPPGQYVTPDFPILSAGPTPHIPLEEWSFALQYGPDRLGEWNTSRGRRPGASICCEPHRAGSRASGRARWHAHADKKIQDGRASGHQERGATWLDYYR